MLPWSLYIPLFFLFRCPFHFGKTIDHREYKKKKKTTPKICKITAALNPGPVTTGSTTFRKRSSGDEGLGSKLLSKKQLLCLYGTDSFHSKPSLTTQASKTSNDKDHFSVLQYSASANSLGLHKTKQRQEWPVWFSPFPFVLLFFFFLSGDVTPGPQYDVKHTLTKPSSPAYSIKGPYKFRCKKPQFKS